MKRDLKTKIDKEDFIEIQNALLTHGILWDSSGMEFKTYHKDNNYMYYRSKSNTMQYGIHEYNYDLDIAKEVSVEDFILALIE